MTKLFFTVGFFIFSMSCLAQQVGSLTGKVTNARGEGLPGIAVMLKGSSQGVATQVDGRYSLTDIASGRHKIVVSGVGLANQEIWVSIKAGEITRQDFVMQEDATEMEEVIIQAESEAEVLRLSAKAVQVIDTREVKLKTADLGEVMAQTEGVSVQRAGGLGSNVRFSLNGLSGDQIRFFYDGVPLSYTPYAFGIANVPVNMIDQVEVYKGVVPIQFGADALGGAVNLASPEVYAGWAGSASYQVGSFGTHRATANINYASTKTGFFVVAGGFHDYTDNNYEIDVAIPNERGQLEPRTVPRFHDGYRAYGTNLRVGVRGKKWANELSVEGYYGDYDNEIQNRQSPGLIDRPSLGISNAVAGSPFGEVRFTSFSKGANLHYNVTPTSRWELDLRAGYNYNERVSIDTSRNLYSWLGEVIQTRNEPGEFGGFTSRSATHLITLSESAFARQQLTYSFSDRHRIKLAVAPTYSYRTGDDLLIDNELDDALNDRYLFDLVSGLEYTSEWLDKRLQNIAFVKNYLQNIRTETFDQSIERTVTDKRSANNYGVGNALKYDWSPRFSTKLSYEFAYRLPRLNEIFGDGQFILENLEVGPESSHNLNAQWSYESKAKTATEWQLSGNFFLRRIDDLIFFLVDTENFGSFQNVWSATSQGFELSGVWKDLVEGLTLSANTTYQSYINTSDDGPFESFEGDRLPNTPYLFANGAAQYRLQDVLQQNDKLSFFWNMRFVQSFLIGWESVGLANSKLEVPSQTVHTAGLTHRMSISRVQSALTVEVQNLANAKVFDFFGVQRPGRAFYVKLTAQF